MKPRTALVFLAVAVLLLSVEARKKSSKNKSGGRGQASKQAPLRSSKNRQKEVQNNAAVKKAVASMRSGRVKQSGSAPSPTNLNQPQRYPSQQQNRPPSATNMQQQQPQSAGAPNYNQPPPTYQQAVGGGYGPPQPQQQMMQPVAYPQGGYPQGGYPMGGAPMPMGYPMMAPNMMQQQAPAPAPKKGLIPDWLKPKLMIDVVPLAMMAAKPIKSLFSSRKDDKQNEMRRRMQAENGTADNSTSFDGNNTMAGPPFMFPPLNGSQPEFPPPPFPPPVEGENMTAEGMQPQPPQQPFPFMAPPQQYVDENGTVHHYHHAPMPSNPYGMYPPPMQQQGENGSVPMMYQQPYAYPYPYPYQYAPQANPFIRNKMPQLEGQKQVAEPMIAVEAPETLVDPAMPERQVDPQVPETDEDTEDDATESEDEVTSKTGDIPVKKSSIMHAIKPAVAAPVAA